MILLGIHSRELALLVSSSLDGEKIYAFTLDDCVRLAKLQRPEVIILGSRLGGTTRRAVEVIPQLERLCEAHIVVMMNTPSRGEMAEAVQFGAFGTVDLDDELWDRRLERIIAASSRRRALLAVPSPRVMAGGLRARRVH